LNVSGNILFSSNKKISKTYWLYTGQIIYDPGSIPGSNFTAMDAMGRDGGPWSSNYRASIAASGNYYVTSIRVEAGEYVSIPVDISKGQKLTEVRIRGGSSSSSKISYQIVSRLLNSSSFAATAEYSSSIISRNSNGSFVDNISFTVEITSSVNEKKCYFIVIKNEHTILDDFDTITLEFESNNLFELLGIS
jgi:hypothetical protein